MLLEKLREYSGRLDLDPPMYLKTPIKWLIDLDGRGRFINFVPTTQEAGSKKDRGKEFSAPHIGRASGVRAKLLADNGEYVLGLARDKSKQIRADECHRAFVEQVRTCADTTGEQSVRAVLGFLEHLDVAELSFPKDWDPAHTMTFRVQGLLPINLRSVQEYWCAVAAGDEEANSKSADMPMSCLICGQLRPPVKRHQFKIKRIPGGQTSGMAMISANVPAFESYGLEASLIAPTCQQCGEQFTKAANTLIEGEDTHVTVGPLVYIFWTKGEQPFSVATLLGRPEPSDVRALIESAFRGTTAATKLDGRPFYATAFSASGGRVVVRDWLDTTIGEVRRNLARYFVLQRLIEWDGAEGRPYGLFALGASTVHDVNRELSPQVPKALLHMALKGGPLPMWLLFQAVKRNRAEQGITRPRAVLIKMALFSQRPNIGEDSMINLNMSDQDQAYLCGRLLAVLEAIQREAIPGAKATITDRFFGTASSAPASVFGRLIRGAQPHLARLRKDRRGAYEALEKRLEEVQQNLATFPKTLTLQEQGLFGLGYYHQRAADRAAAIAHKQARNQQAD
ncbi:MAG: CRISPR-associated protein, Csd1 family [Nitrospira sp.]|jgi:CRISPR-associated protein Csd1|nr:MAG: CRISPR-associated protein, Csd1 family [Nitrospira sp.]